MKVAEKSRYCDSGETNRHRVVLSACVRETTARYLISSSHSFQCDERSNSRIYSRGIRRFYFFEMTKCTPQVRGVNRSVLRSTWSNSSPTTYKSVIGIQNEREFSFDFVDVLPIYNGGRKRILDAHSDIGKDYARTLNSKINHGSAEDDEYCKRSVLTCCEGSIQKSRRAESQTHEIAETAVESRPAGAQDVSISAVDNQFLNRRCHG